MQEIIGIIFMSIGFVFVAIAMFGVYRFKYVLNRMHAVAICDTMGMFFILLSLILATCSPAYLPKLLLLLLFLWIGSPIASHLVSRLEVSTDESAAEDGKEEDRS